MLIVSMKSSTQRTCINCLRKKILILNKTTGATKNTETITRDIDMAAQN
jgi:hypothetical protein